MTPPTPLFIIELIKSLGLGQQIFITLVLLFAAFELFRGVKAGKRAGGFVGRAVFYVIAIAVAAAISIGFGWMEPNTSVIMSDVNRMAASLWEWVGHRIADFLP